MKERRAYLVLLGAPGAGKGTQAQLLASSLTLPQVSTGDLFRYHQQNQTDLGRLIKSYMTQGTLVPDEITIRLVEERLSRPDCAKGAIMDGFPRTLQQAAAFDVLTKPFGGVLLAPLINLSDAEVIKRISGRRSCRTCNTIYHVDYHPPKTPGVCDLDGGELYQREDDEEGTVRNRLYVYYKQTSPLIGYYYAKGLLREFDGSRPIQDIFAEMEIAVRTAQAA